MFVAINLETQLTIINLDHITEIKCDWNNNILVFCSDDQVPSNWNYTFVDTGALTNAYNHIADGLLHDMKLITIDKGLA